MVILSKGLRYIRHLKGIYPSLCFFPLVQCTIADVFVDVFINALPVILTFDKMINPVNSLVS